MKLRVSEVPHKPILPDLTVETLECLKFVSGWEVTSVNGSTIKLAFGNMNVTFEMNAFGPGGTATVEMVDNPDPIHQFTSVCLRGSVLKGDVQKVAP
jgi:hypothetical protein